MKAAIAYKGGEISSSKGLSLGHGLGCVVGKGAVDLGFDQPSPSAVR